MWAMIPMLRTLSRGWVRFASAMSFVLSLHANDRARPGRRGEHLGGAPPGGSGVSQLPAVVGEGPVGLGHLLHVLTPLDGGADAVAGVEQLVGEALGHRLLTALAGEADHPADGQGVGS